MAKRAALLTDPLHQGEFRRGGAMSSVAALLPAITPRLELQRAPIDRLEALERQLVLLLEAAAPSTWSTHRRTLHRVLRQARRELRGRADHSSLTS